MSDYAQGDTVRDYITVLDVSGGGVTGVSFSTVSTLDPDDDPFSISITEIGNGTYRVVYLAEKTGTYYWKIQTIGLSFNQTFESTSTIGPFSLYGVAAGLMANGNTLSTLIQMLATQLGDYLEVVATQDGAADGSTFVDELRLAAISPSALKGSALMIAEPTTSDNYTIERRILDSSEDNTMLTVKPNFPVPVLAGQKGWITNLYSKGFWTSQYITNINLSIEKARGHLVPISYTYPNAFTAADNSIPLPQYMTHIYGVTAYDDAGNVLEIPESNEQAVNTPGWALDSPSGSIIIGGTYWPLALNGWFISLLGYGRPSPLVNFSDVTTLDMEWIVYDAAARMRWSKGDQKRYPEASNMENRSDLTMVSTLTPMHPNTIRVR